MSDGDVPRVLSASIAASVAAFKRGPDSSSDTSSEAGFTAAPVEKFSFFGKCVLLIWPKPEFKPEYELHLRTGKSTRICRWWMDGTYPPNGAAIRCLLGEIIARLGANGRTAD